jgi:prephenate dehydratase
MKNVAIQGEIGSFHYAAALSWYGKAVSIVACNTFKKTFESLDTGIADAAVVAIENSLHGSINEVYDLLLEYRYPIVGEVAEHIHQCLIGQPDVAIEEINIVHSHPVALSQCSVFLEEKLPLAERNEWYDTAASVALVKNAGDRHQAAIASSAAAKLHNMKILAHDIQNVNQNYTRFLIIEKQPTQTVTTKSSLVVETHHKPGALYDILGIINNHKVNISKLQSRPSKKTVWRYMFYIDIECNASKTQTILTEIRSISANATLLGSYKASITTIDI